MRRTPHAPNHQGHAKLTLTEHHLTEAVSQREMTRLGAAGSHTLWVGSENSLSGPEDRDHPTGKQDDTPLMGRFYSALKE